MQIGDDRIETEQTQSRFLDIAINETKCDPPQAQHLLPLAYVDDLVMMTKQQLHRVLKKFESFRQLRLLLEKDLLER